MKCRKQRIELPDYVRGRLAEPDRKAVEDHLAGCERCSSEVAGLRDLFSLIDRPEAGSVSEMRLVPVLPLVHARIAGASQRVLPLWATRVALPLSAAIVLFVGLIRFFPSGALTHPETLQTILQSLPESELSIVREQQMVAEILHPSVSESNSALAPDVEEVQALLEEDQRSALYAISDLPTETAELSDEDARAVLPILQRDLSSKEY